MFCSKCGKPNPDGASFCSACGASFNGVPSQNQPLPPPPPVNGGKKSTGVLPPASGKKANAPSSKVSGMAITSLILGIVSILILMLTGWPFLIALLAVIFGHTGLSKVNKSDGAITGKGMAITGFVLGYISILGNIIHIIIS